MIPEPCGEPAIHTDPGAALRDPDRDLYGQADKGKLENAETINLKGEWL